MAYTYTLDKNTYGPALQALDKVDVLFAEVENPEVQLSSLILRAYIFTQKQAYKEAVDILWRSYEKAKLSGFYPHISSILAQLARVYRDQKHEEQFQLYAELALKGTDKVKKPRLYKMISEICPMGLESLRPQNDFEIDESSRVVKERSKGNIDFKNPHILYELVPLGAIVRRNFSFAVGENSVWNRLYRRWIDRRLAKRHRLTDYFFSLEPVEPVSRLQRIFSLAHKWVVEVEAHPVKPDEYRFLMEQAILR